MTLNEEREEHGERGNEERGETRSDENGGARGMGSDERKANGNRR